MGILDEAIREHLELKKAHGAADDELQKLEDEAFGPAERPSQEQPAVDPFAEAPTQFMTTPETSGSSPRAEVETPPPFPRPNITDLQEAPPEPAVEEPAETAAEEGEPAVDEEPAETAAEEAEPAADGGAETVDAAPEMEATPGEAASGPSTEERHAIAAQPTELYDVEGDLGEAAPSPTEEVAEESAAPAAAEEPEEDDFFDEQRLSDELDQALEAPVADEADEDFWGGGRPSQESGQTLDDEEPEEDEPGEAEPATEDSYEEDAEELEEADEEESSEEHTAVYDRTEDDVLEDTPDFLEDAPEDDQLWFEQKPPKDFDFDD